MCNSSMCTCHCDCTFIIVNILLSSKKYTEFQCKAAPLKIVGVQSFIGLRHSCRPPGALNVWTRKDDMWEKQVRQRQGINLREKERIYLFTKKERDERSETTRSLNSTRRVLCGPDRHKTL